MKPTKEQQQALLGLITRIYQEIRTLEEANRIMARPEDFRPRIEYFHDAIRVFTQGAGDGFDRVGRLSVESLANDIVMLRQIKEKPLVRHPELNILLAPGTQVAIPASLPAQNTTRVDVAVVSALAEGYSHYALLFAALLSYPAERNFMNRTGEANNQLDMVHDLIEQTKPKAQEAQVNEEAALAGITDPELRQRLVAALAAAKKQKRASGAELLAAAKQVKEATTKDMQKINTEHMRFASSQLVLFQDARNLVKKMASQGLNIVGDFVEQAVREAERGSGRGF